MHKVTSIEHAQQINGTAVNFDQLRQSMHAAGVEACEVEPQIADMQIKMIVKANNKLNNWVNNQGVGPYQRKYFAWKDRSADSTKPSGVGFSHSITDYWCTHTDVGARLEVGSHDEAMYICTDFEHLYEIAWLIIPEQKAEETKA